MTKKSYIITIVSLLVVFLIVLILFLIFGPLDKEKNPNQSVEFRKYSALYDLKLIEQENEKYYAILGLTTYSKSQTKIEFPATIDAIPVKKIISEERSFSDYRNIQIIYISENIDYIGTKWDDFSYGQDIFAMCMNLKSIQVDAKNQTYASNNGVLYSKDEKVLLKYPHALTLTDTNKFNVPTEVEQIYDAAFKNHPSITEVVISENVQSIGVNAFLNCDKLTTITFSEHGNLTEIKSGAFSKLENIQSILLPEGVVRIGHSAFSECAKLIELFIPKTTTEFGNQICTGSSSVIISTTTEHLDFLKSKSENLGIKENIDLRIVVKR